MDIQGKIAVVTGASSGIGAEIAKALHDQGAHVVLLSRKIGVLQQMETELGDRVSVFELDVTNPEQVQDVFREIEEKYGRIDILINNAGFGVFKKLIDSDLLEIEAMMAVNYLGVVRCTYAVLPGMIKRNMGSIVNIASLAGKIGTAKSTGYSATKHAVLGFCNSLRLELKDTAIHIGAMNPGPVDTRFFEKADPTGNYVNSVRWMMLTPQKVAMETLQMVQKRKAEVDLPKWLGYFTRIYALAPRFFDRLTAGIMDRK